MLTEEQRKHLVFNDQGATLEGHRCGLAGWRNPFTCSITADFAGFWEASWDTVQRVMSGNKNFLANDVRFVSWGWLGLDVEVPRALIK